MSDTIPPLIYRWEASTNSMRCLSNRASNYFQDGERYMLEAREERSGAHHRAFFASINEAWKSLPEGEERWPSPDHLRRWALCKAGYCDEEVSVWETAKDAKAAAALMRKMDGYAVITVKGNTVRRFTARSQKQRQMDAKTFRESCQAVERIIADEIGVSVSELRKAKESA